VGGASNAPLAFGCSDAVMSLLQRFISARFYSAKAFYCCRNRTKLIYFLLQTLQSAVFVGVGEKRLFAPGSGNSSSRAASPLQLIEKLGLPVPFKYEMTNYRPISLLTCFSKFLKNL